MTASAAVSLKPGRFRAGGMIVFRTGWRSELTDHPPVVQPGGIRRLKGGKLLPRELQGAVIALGNFDGCHVGHRAVIDRAVHLARCRGVAAIVATFDPHPVRHFTPDGVPFQLTTLTQRQCLFAQAGVDAMLLFEFDGGFANVTPQEFVRHWLPGVGGVVTGDGFTFGRRRAGTAQVFTELAAVEGMSYEAVQPVLVGGERVSSTRVREALRQGDCITVRKLLSRPFAISGLASCDRRSQPSNVSIDMAEYVRPRVGSYAAMARFDDGYRMRCIARIDPLATAELQAAVLELVAPEWQRELQGCIVEVDLLDRCPDIS